MRFGTAVGNAYMSDCETPAVLKTRCRGNTDHGTEVEVRHPRDASSFGSAQVLSGQRVMVSKRG